MPNDLTDVDCNNNLDNWSYTLPSYQDPEEDMFTIKLVVAHEIDGIFLLDQTSSVKTILSI